MNTLSTSDLNARLEELEGMQEAYRESLGTSMPEAPLDEEEEIELAELVNLRDEIGDEWANGETLIPVSEFEEYARDLAHDIGAVPEDGGWPLYCIDWEYAARELAHDYSVVTYQGTDYYVSAS